VINIQVGMGDPVFKGVYADYSSDSDDYHSSICSSSLDRLSDISEEYNFSENDYEGNLDQSDQKSSAFDNTDNNGYGTINTNTSTHQNHTDVEDKKELWIDNIGQVPSDESVVNNSTTHMLKKTTTE